MIELQIVSKMLRDIEQACNDSNLSDWEFRALMKNLISGKTNTHLENIKKENKKRIGEKENQLDSDKLLYLEKKIFTEHDIKLQFSEDDTTKYKIKQIENSLKVLNQKNPRKVY